jgi:RNA polymerase sigma-70 factor (ECF subfamily)
MPMQAHGAAAAVPCGLAAHPRTIAMHEPPPDTTVDLLPAAPAVAAAGVHPDDVGEVYELVEAARAGDRGAFRHLYDRFSPRVWSYVRLRISPDEDAEDVTAETFLAAWRALGRFSWTGAPFGGWLLGIASLQLRQHHRSRSRRPTTPLEDPTTIAGVADDHAELHVERSEAKRLLALLPEDQRTVLVLVCVDGLSYREAADVLGIPIGTVMSRISRGRLELHALLNGQTKTGTVTPFVPRRTGGTTRA